MRKLLIIGAAALTLAGCAGSLLTGTTVPAQTAYLAVNTFNTVKGGATAYDSLPRCGATVSAACNQLATVKAIDAAVRTASVPVRRLQALLDAACGLPLGTGIAPSSAVNCAPVSVSAYDAVETAITTLQGAYSAYGIATPAS